MGNDRIEQDVASMTRSEKIGQLWMSNFCGDDSLETISSVLAAYKFGGVMLSVNYKRFLRQKTKIPNGVSDVRSPDELAAWISQIQRCAVAETGVPLLIGIDQEGGLARSLLRRGGFTVVPAQLGLASSASALADTKLAARIVGTEMASAGFNMVYGPVLDLNTNPANPEVGARSFGGDPTLVAALGTAYMEEMVQAGVIPCPKHFPGRGRGANDSHFVLETISATRQELLSHDIRPFSESIDTPAIMVGHTLYQDLDRDYPASLSYKIITELLRKQLDFDGVILTDELTMWAIAHHYGVADAALLSLRAGADMFFLKAPEHFEDVAARIDLALDAGDLEESRVNESVARVLRLKRRFGIISDSRQSAREITVVRRNKATRIVGRRPHQRAAQDLADRSLVITRGEPLSGLSRGTNVLVVVPRAMCIIQTNDGVHGHDELPRAIGEEFENVDHIVVDEDPAELQLFDLEVRSSRMDLVVILVGDQRWTKTLDEVSERILTQQRAGTSPAVVALLADSPSVTTAIHPLVSTVYCSFCMGPAQYRAFSRELIRGEGRISHISSTDE